MIYNVEFYYTDKKGNKRLKLLSRKRKYLLLQELKKYDILYIDKHTNNLKMEDLTR